MTDHAQDAAACVHRIAVTPRNGAPHGAGFACGLSGGHCLPKEGCGFEAPARTPAAIDAQSIKDETNEFARLCTENAHLRNQVERAHSFIRDAGLSQHFQYETGQSVTSTVRAPGEGQ